MDIILRGLHLIYCNRTLHALLCDCTDVIHSTRLIGRDPGLREHDRGGVGERFLMSLLPYLCAGLYELYAFHATRHYTTTTAVL